MTKCYVVVEGPVDAALLSFVLADTVQSGEVTVVDARGQSSAVSLARTLLVKRPASVALVVGSETTVRSRVAGMRAELEESLAVVASARRFGVFLGVPSLQACLFRDDAGLRREFGDALTSALFETSRDDPEGVLIQLLGTHNHPYDPHTVTALLASLDVRKLCQDSVITDIMAFLSAALGRGVLGASLGNGAPVESMKRWLDGKRGFLEERSAGAPQKVGRQLWWVQAELERMKSWLDSYVSSQSEREEFINMIDKAVPMRIDAVFLDLLSCSDALFDERVRERCAQLRGTRARLH